MVLLIFFLSRPQQWIPRRYRWISKANWYRNPLEKHSGKKKNAKAKRMFVSGPMFCWCFFCDPKSTPIKTHKLATYQTSSDRQGTQHQNSWHSNEQANGTHHRQPQLQWLITSFRWSQGPRDALPGNLKKKTGHKNDPRFEPFFPGFLPFFPDNFGPKGFRIFWGKFWKKKNPPDTEDTRLMPFPHCNQQGQAWKGLQG